MSGDDGVTGDRRMTDRMRAARDLTREIWGWRDRRTGQRVSRQSTYARDSAQRQLDSWIERDRRGGRPDLHELLPHVEVYRIHPPEVVR